MMEKKAVPVEVFYEPHVVQSEDVKATYAKRRELRRARRKAKLDAEREHTANSKHRVVLSCMVCGASMSVKIDRESPTINCPCCGREQDISVFLDAARRRLRREHKAGLP